VTKAFEIKVDAPQYDGEVGALYAHIFGPGRHAKAAARLREGAQNWRAGSCIALENGVIIGACKLWPVETDLGDKLLFLGPIGVSPQARKAGIGRHMLNTCLEACDRLAPSPIVLVGDHAYFAPFGFRPVPAGALALPGPADSRRILWRPAPSFDQINPQATMPKGCLRVSQPIEV
jgi:predicted N-acetyltransferase YhbS